jgi:diguanylate cyclase (GGDEF)-like protein
VRRALRSAFLLDEVPTPHGEILTRHDLRLRICAHDYPRILLWGTVILLFFSLVNLLTSTVDRALSHVLDVVIAVGLVLFAWVMARPGIPRAALPWLFIAATTSAISGLLVQVLWEDQAIAYGYALIAMCFVGAATLAWRPFLTGAAALTGVAALVTSQWQTGDPADWIVAWLAAVAVSSVLLRLRLRSIDALADAITAAHRASITDELTGLLNRRGLHENVRSGTWVAEPTVFAVFVDIAGLKEANDRYGHDFGDRVIQASARAVLGAARSQDLAARWGGDEFVLIGAGDVLEAEAFAQRLDTGSVWTGKDSEAWDGDLSVGISVAPAADLDLDRLLTCADADMYRRRAR